jgi:hypothetical protein
MCSKNRRKVDAIACGVLILTLTSHVSFADEDVAASARQSLLTASGPSPTSQGPGGANKASVTASTDKTTAQTQLTDDWIIGTRWFLSGNLMAEAPVTDTKNTNKDLGSVSALTAGVNGRLSFWGGSLPAPQSSSETNYLNDVCTHFLKSVLGSDGYDTYQKMPGSDKPAMSCGDRARNAQTALPELMKSINAYRKKSNKDATDLKLQTDWIRNAHEAQLKFDSLPPAATDLNFFGLSILGNQHSYSYVTTSAPTDILSSNTVGYGVGVSWMRVMQHLAFIIGYSYERPYKGGKGDSVCKPIGTSTSTTCSSAAVGAPTLSLANIVSGELRAAWGRVALAPRLQYDATGHNVGVALPLYVRTTSSQSFTTGVEVGWTRNSHFQGGIVIQKAFSFFN